MPHPKSRPEPADHIMSLTYERISPADEPYRIGLIVLQSDASIELEFQQALAQAPKGERSAAPIFHYARIPNADSVTPETLREMHRHLPDTAALLPSHLNLRAIGYACTSASLMIGKEEVARLIGKHHANMAVSDPMTAAVKACHALGLKKIGFLSPYIDEVSEPMRQKFADEGIAIAAYLGFRQGSDAEVSRIAEPSTLKALQQINGMAECDGFFASCTNLRTFGILQEAESLLKKPVISSNLALLWDLLNLSESPYRPQNLGALLSSKNKR